jgi:DNA-binding transcriptional ArsR family regulator
VESLDRIAALEDNRASRRSRFDWNAIREYYERGHTLKQCQARFGFSNGAWSCAVSRGDIIPRGGSPGRRSAATRAAVGALLERGVPRSEIARRLGVSKPTVTYHAARLGYPSSSRAAARYDWTEIQRYYDEGHSITECQERFGFARASFVDAVRRGAIVSRPAAPPITTYLVSGRRRNRGNLKRRLIAAGIMEPLCESCGIAEWQGRPLALALHHVNGDGRDNRLENLQLLCPNCHSQTENFAGRNVARNENGATPAA